MASRLIARGLIAAAAIAALVASSACGRSDLFGESAGLLDNGGATAGSGRSSTGHGTGPNTSASNGPGGGSTSAGQGSGVQGSGGTVGDIGTNSGGQGPGGGTSSGLTSTGATGSSASGSGGSSAGGSGGSGIGTSNGGISGTGIGGSSGGPVSNSSGGIGASGGSGGTGGAGPGGGSTGGGCDATAKETPRKPCTADSDCGCPDTCVDDPPFGKDCERPCVRQSDCNDTSYVCNGTYCQFNTCGGQTGNGTFNSTCDVVGTNDGTCVPFKVNGQIIGECVKGGTATSCCNQDATPSESALLCAAGTICSGIEGGFCGQICDPFNPDCPGGQFCAFELNDSMTGGCFSSGQTSSCNDGG